jgi:nicotinate-nucleotide pyrophosphorylase (carboxylating)
MPESAVFNREKPLPSFKQELDSLIDLALHEDLGTVGDLSSQAVFDETQEGRFRIICREDMVIFGLAAITYIGSRFSSDLRIEVMTQDACTLSVGDVVCRIEGKVRRILELERTMLNFLGYLSGIASKTRIYVELARSLGNTKILDTRKTLPGWRLLSKAAVRAGGACNHRLGLYDMIMLKDNHIDAAGGIKAALTAVRKCWGSKFPIEVECRNVIDVRQALSLDVEVAMLDNMSPEDCAEAVRIRSQEFAHSHTVFEASGDMNIEKLQKYAGLGLDFISIGALTHSVKNANFSMGMEV